MSPFGDFEPTPHACDQRSDEVIDSPTVSASGRRTPPTSTPASMDELTEYPDAWQICTVGRRNGQHRCQQHGSFTPWLPPLEAVGNIKTGGEDAKKTGPPTPKSPTTKQ